MAKTIGCVERRSLARLLEPEDVPGALARYMDGLRRHEVPQILATLSEQVRFITPDRVLKKDEVGALLTCLFEAFPNWSYNHKGVVQCGDGSYAVAWEQQGRHEGVLNHPGVERVAPTFREVLIPRHYFFYRLANAQLIEIQPDPVPGSAPKGIFDQIGRGDWLG